MVFSKHENTVVIMNALFKQKLLKMVTRLKNSLEPAMFCHLAVLIYLCGELTQRQGKRPNVYAKQKEFKNFFKQGQGSPSYSFSRNLNFNKGHIISE